MSNASLILNAIDANDLALSSATAKYPLGAKFVCVNASGNIAEYTYVQAPVGGTVANRVYVIGDATYVLATPATSLVGKLFGVSPVALGISEYGFVATAGKGISATSAGATTSGNTVSMANGVVTVTDEAGTVPTDSSIGIVRTTAGVAGTVLIDLIQSKRATI